MVCMDRIKVYTWSPSGSWRSQHPNHTLVDVQSTAAFKNPGKQVECGGD